ncbi:GmrSD restriction endonuclease domain-containing protein [Priestia megaterium]|uniref:GmrSD restriction endonuclease domain-containing protein n=1 Tax=Priestia megaterium TaxID=1404 RepID=UPI00300049F5
MKPRYEVNNSSIESILSWIRDGEIAIPEIQRPFVWDSSKVRDLMDSLYKGFPVGYIITWRSPDTNLKDGTRSEGKKILIDGQQRITALTAALLGEHVVMSDYQKKRIRIAFHPIEERFEVLNPAIEKDSLWIPDISAFFAQKYPTFQFVMGYCKKNNISDFDEVANKIDRLMRIRYSNLGIIELSHELDIETVTEIFIRINSQGVVLSQADFAMSKIAVNETYNGINIRKTIDYFCHLAKRPGDFQLIEQNDTDFSRTHYFSKLRWIKDYIEKLYVPDYSDLLRVAFTHKFLRGKLADLVSLLSGRDFSTREYKEVIAEDSFNKLEEGVLEFINETNFKRYIMIVKSTGIIHKKMIRSQNVLNFGYILYLLLKERGINKGETSKIVRRWLVLSILTKRYSGSPESMFEFDARRFKNAQKPIDYLQHTENGELSAAFWENILISRLNTPVTSSPYFNLYIMAQVKNNEKAFLSKETEVRHLIEGRGDVHHIFPRKYLQRNGYANKNQYNQIANYAIIQQEINIAIGDRAPEQYMESLNEQCKTKILKYGEIVERDELMKNLKGNSIPTSIFQMDATRYEDFLEERRKLMAEKIKYYYQSL